VEEDVPHGLGHAAGRELEYEVGVLRPGETRQLELVLRADEQGMVTNVLRVRGDGQLFAEHTAQLEVIAPQLEIALSGPKRRFLEREVTYEISVANPGTAPAGGIELITHLPKGLQFVTADHQAQYDQQNHAVYWSFEELPPEQQGVVQLTALPIETGDQKLLVEGRSGLGLSSQYEHTTTVEAVAEVRFTVSDLQDPIEVGSETTYEVRIVNNGSMTATNIQFIAEFPPGLTPVDGEGPTRVAINSQQVFSEPLTRLAPGGDAVYRIRVHHTGESGDYIARVQLASEEAPTPVTKEESTHVYDE
jgi:uncharacterized repeat protein (TIGR01451 family)